MAVVKNMSTESNRAFWEHVERITAQSRHSAESVPCQEASEGHLVKSSPDANSPRGDEEQSGSLIRT